MRQPCSAIIKFGNVEIKCQQEKEHTGYHSYAGYVDNKCRFHINWEEDMSTEVKNDKKE